MARVKQWLIIHVAFVILLVALVGYKAAAALARACQRLYGEAFVRTWFID